MAGVVGDRKTFRNAPAREKKTKKRKKLQYLWKLHYEAEFVKMASRLKAERQATGTSQPA